MKAGLQKHFGVLKAALMSGPGATHQMALDCKKTTDLASVLLSGKEQNQGYLTANIQIQKTLHIQL